MGLQLRSVAMAMYHISMRAPFRSSSSPWVCGATTAMRVRCGEGAPLRRPPSAHYAPLTHRISAFKSGLVRTADGRKGLLGSSV